jgi:peptide/nickel transport system substrate-binding protein
LIAVIALVACAAPTPTPAPKPTDVPKPTAVPPTAVPATKAPEPLAANMIANCAMPTGLTAVPFNPEPVKSTITINLRKNAKWSDGTPFTAKDVVGTFDILWMQSSSTWNSLVNVVAKDDNTVEFQISRPGPAILDTIVRGTTTRPYAQLGKCMDAAAAYRKNNTDRKGDAVKKTLDELNAFRSPGVLVYGPYNIDPKQVTEAQLTMVKNATGFNADKIDFDKVTIYWGDTVQDMPLYLSNDMDYSSNAYSPANLAAIRAVGNHMVVLGGPGTNGPGMYFNNDVYPLNKKEVRQAFAYAIDRVENCKVAFGDACRPVKYQVGFTDAAVPTWLSAAQLAKLNTYDADVKKAEALLTGLNFKKGADGIWVDDKGKKMEFELSVPADFTEYLASSENVAQQLTKFGIKITVKPYQSTERTNLHKSGKYQISMDIGFRFTYFHPYVSYDYNLRPGIVSAGWKNNPEGNEGERGMNLPFKQKTADGKEINIKELVDKMAEGFDAEAQKPYVADVASFFNDSVPVLAMFERYLTDPIDTKTRVTGWLPADDKIYKNNQNNSPVARQFLSGQLKPSATNRAKEFKTSYPYIPPPKAHYNPFVTDNILNQGAVMSTFMYPPFTFYDVNEGKYVPFFAESWSIK